MPEDTLRLTVDPGNSFDVLRRIGGEADRLGGAGERVGAGFIRGDRAVRRATQSITQGLLSVNTAADATLLTFGALERVFKLPLVSTIGAAAGIAGTAALAAEFRKTEAAVNALRGVLRVPLSVQIGLSPEDIASRIDEVTKATDALIKRSESGGEKVARFFAAAASGGMQTAAGREAEQTRLIAEGEKRAADLAGERADKELDIANLKRFQNTAGKQAADIAKANLDFDSQRAKILEDLIKKGGNFIDVYKRLLAAQISLNEAGRKNVDIQAKMAGVLKNQQDTGKQATDFFTDLGSGKFARDFAEKQRTDFQQQAGRDLAKRIEAGQEKGFFKDPLSQAALKEAQRISDRAGTSVQELANTDFSNLLELSKYDFSGLQPLSGLTLTIQ